MVVQTKVVGRRGLVASWEISDTFAYRSLRDLIRTLVEREVAAFRDRQEERKLTRVLTNEQIASAVQTGRIHMGGDDITQQVDPERAVEAALTAFRDGFYFVFVDDVQIEDLDTPVELNPASQLLFLRLIPLAGG